MPPLVETRSSQGEPRVSLSATMNASRLVFMTCARLGFVLALLLWLAPSARAGVARADCFPFERLPPGLHGQAEALLLAALDSEALFTLVGGIKPLSSGFAGFDIAVEAPDLANVDETRRILAHWRCGDTFYADVMAFAQVHDGRRALHAFVAEVPAVAALVAARRAFFGRLGLSPAAHPLQVVLAVEHAPPDVRFRGYGWLFGYPDDAVDFFVGAAIFQDLTGIFVARDFRSAPTFQAETHRFVWAVAKDQSVTTDEQRLIDRASAVLASYRRRREQYVGQGRPGVLALVRDWFCPSETSCAPALAATGR
jgi:hypothetical protein